MNIALLESIDDVYGCGKRVSIRWQSTKFPEFKSFAVSLDRFISALGDSTKDDYWVSLVRRLKRFRFDCCAAPLQLEILQKYVKDLLFSLEPTVEGCQAMYPNAMRQLALLMAQLDALTRTDLAILLDTLVSLPDIQHKSTALLIREPRLIPEVISSLKPYQVAKNIEVINPTMLREQKCYKRLVIIGPSRWYPGYVFTAPRAPNLLLIKYSWIKDHWKQENAFLDPVKQRTTRKQMLAFADSEDDSTISPDDLLPPSTDFNLIAGKALGDFHDAGEEYDLIDARIYLLEEGWAVFLEADDTNTVLVIDFESDEDKPVRRTKIGDLNIGMYVLLRTGGGGDYIIPVADRIMGK
jgi:hypothetical protein